MEDMLKKIGGAVDRIGIPHMIGHSKEAEKLINDLARHLPPPGGGVRMSRSAENPDLLIPLCVHP